jgi:hypothetical protein
MTAGTPDLTAATRSRTVRLGCLKFADAGYLAWSDSLMYGFYEFYILLL